MKTMTDESQIPKPDESGSSGQQQRADTQQGEYLPAKWAGSSPVSNAMGTLAASKSTAFGSEAATALIVANMRVVELEKSQLTRRNTDLEHKLEKLRDDLEEARLRISKLEGRLETQTRLKRVRKILTVLAGLAVGVGTGFISLSDDTGISIAAFAAAVMCLVGSWFVEDKEGRE